MHDAQMTVAGQLGLPPISGVDNPAASRMSKGARYASTSMRRKLATWCCEHWQRNLDKSVG